MNRKKAILLLAGTESFLLAICMVLFISGTINFKAFIGLALAIGIVSSAVIVAVIRKLNP